MWQVYLNPGDTQYYLCDRFFTDEKYRAFSKLPVDEIISVDSGLFPEKYRLDEYSAKTLKPVAGKQIMCVLCVNSLPPFFDAEGADDFGFCGYDLADAFGISALTNCGGFEETFTHQDLNAFGLIPDFHAAKRIQRKLQHSNPDEPHADSGEKYSLDTVYLALTAGLCLAA